MLIPLDGIRLIGPDGKELPAVAPEAVAAAVFGDSMPSSKAQAPPVQVAAGPKVASSRTDKTSPNYDPRLDPSDPRYDPYDPRNTGRNRGYNDPRIIPGVDVILNPSGGGGNDDEISGRLIEKDFADKAHTEDPIPSSLRRDRFLYFSITDRPKGINGFELRLPKGKGVSQDVVLIF